MKRTILTLLTATFFAVLTLGAQDNSRKQEKDTLYFKASQMPDAVVFLPAPPSDSSLLMKYDISRYEWGKTLRDTPRGELAKLHATTKIPEMCRLFSTGAKCPLRQTRIASRHKRSDSTAVCQAG